jgi:hypothetical protein
MWSLFKRFFSTSVVDEKTASQVDETTPSDVVQASNGDDIRRPNSLDPESSSGALDGSDEDTDTDDERMDDELSTEAQYNASESSSESDAESDVEIDSMNREDGCLHVDPCAELESESVSFLTPEEEEADGTPPKRPKLMRRSTIAPLGTVASPAGTPGTIVNVSNTNFRDPPVFTPIRIVGNDTPTVSHAFEAFLRWNQDNSNTLFHVPNAVATRTRSADKRHAEAVQQRQPFKWMCFQQFHDTPGQIQITDWSSRVFPNVRLLFCHRSVAESHFADQPGPIPHIDFRLATINQLSLHNPPGVVIPAQCVGADWFARRKKTIELVDNTLPWVLQRHACDLVCTLQADIDVNNLIGDLHSSPSPNAWIELVLDPRVLATRQREWLCTVRKPAFINALSDLMPPTQRWTPGMGMVIAGQVHKINEWLGMVGVTPRRPLTVGDVLKEKLGWIHQRQCPIFAFTKRDNFSFINLDVLCMRYANQTTALIRRQLLWHTEFLIQPPTHGIQPPSFVPPTIETSTVHSLDALTDALSVDELLSAAHCGPNDVVAISMKEFHDADAAPDVLNVDDDQVLRWTVTIHDILVHNQRFLCRRSNCTAMTDLLDPSSTDWFFNIYDLLDETVLADKSRRLVFVGTKARLNRMVARRVYYSNSAQTPRLAGLVTAFSTVHPFISFFTGRESTCTVVPCYNPKPRFQTLVKMMLYHRPSLLQHTMVVGFGALMDDLQQQKDVSYAAADCSFYLVLWMWMWTYLTIDDRELRSEVTASIRETLERLPSV